MISSHASNQSVQLLLTLIQELVDEIRPGSAAVQKISLDSSIERDLGLDSLSKVELLSRIEHQFDVTISERLFSEAETPRDLLRAVYAALTAVPTADADQHHEASFEISNLHLAAVEKIPLKSHSFIDVLQWHITQHPDRSHIRLYDDLAEGEILTYLDLWKGSKAIAKGLQNKGLKPGETVAIILPTEPDYFFTFLGILLAGGVPVPLYPPARLSHMEDYLKRQSYILSNSRSPFLVTVKEAKRFVHLLKAHVPSLKDIFTVKDLVTLDGDYLQPTVNPNDIALIQYTSGSTGNPKGVVLTNANLIASIQAMGEGLQVKSSDVLVSWLPLYHDMGLIGAWLGSLYYGMLLVIMSPLDFLNRPKRWLWALHRHQGTISVAPNFAYEMCIKRVNEEDLEGLDLSAWRVAMNGAEPVSPETIWAFNKRFKQYGFRQEACLPVYGLAESTLGLSFSPLNRRPLIDEIKRDPFMKSGKAFPAEKNDVNSIQCVSCGLPLPKHEVKIVDTHGRELPERQEGRLVFRGPSATTGYYRHTEATRELFQGDWLNSGDMGYIASGEVYITGRKKDVIIRAGRNIYPQELEEAVGDLGGIRKGNVVVFGVDDPETKTEKLVVIAETRENESSVWDALIHKINNLGAELLGLPPDDVLLVPPRTLLKTSSGKIRRSACKALYEKKAIGKKGGTAIWQVVKFTLKGIRPYLSRFMRTINENLYSAWCWAILGSITPFLLIGVPLIPVFKWRWKLVNMAGRLFLKVCGFRLFTSGFEHIPKDTPSVLIANHASYLDVIIMVALLKHGCRFVVKSELTESILIKPFLDAIRVEYVDRFDAKKGIEDQRRIAQSAREMPPLLYFPEGTLNRVPGLRLFHMGSFITANERGLPVIPIVVRGARSILRPEGWFFRQGRITITIGTAIQSQQILASEKQSDWDAAVQLRNEAREYFLKNCGEPDLGYEKTTMKELLSKEK